MDEPNVVNEEEQEEKSQETTQNSEPTPPKKPNLRMAGRTAIKTTANITRKVMQIFAAMPLPVKIGVIAIIVIVILVTVVLKVEAQESSEQVTESINNVIKNSESLSDEAKELYKKYGSLIKFPIEEILKIYDYYIEEGEFSGSDIRNNYTYVIGKNDIEIKEGTGYSSSSSSSVSGDMQGLVNKAIELAEKGGKYYCMNHDRSIVSTIEEIESKNKFDCSSFVASMFKACLGINIGTTSSDIYIKAGNGNIDGWKVEIHSIGDGEMQPGDVLYRSNHVGIYVGNNKQVDHGGPGGKCACNTSWRGPQNREVSSSYTHYIRYSKQ